MSYDDIQDIIDEGLGFAADELGPPHDVYRVGLSSSGDVLSPANKIASSINVFTKVAYGSGVRESLDTEKQQGIIWYRIIADLRPYQIGDIFIVNDPVYGAGFSKVGFVSNEFNGFALAQRPALKKPLGGRLNCCVQVFRPGQETNLHGQFDRTKNLSNPVVLLNGSFSLGSVGAQACHLPAGLHALRSYGDRQFVESPAEQRKSAWVLYMPALNGFKVREGDLVVDADGARYIVVIPFTQEAGTTGAQWFLERQG